MRSNHDKLKNKCPLEKIRILQNANSFVKKREKNLNAFKKRYRVTVTKGKKRRDETTSAFSYIKNYK